MKTLEQLQEARGALVARVEAIRALCAEEEREPTTDETAEFDRIVGVDGNGGEIATIDAQIEREQRIQDAIAKQAVQAAHRQRIEPVDTTADRIKAAVRSQRFAGVAKGFDSNEEAYRAGLAFAAGVLGHAGSAVLCREFGISPLATTMTEGSPGNGGFVTLPASMESAIIRLVLEYGAFRRNARNVAMPSEVHRFPRRTAGVTAYYITETGTPTESNPTFGMAELVAKDLAVLCKVSNNLVDDAIIDMVNFVTMEIALAIAYAEDSAGFSGTGLSATGGITGLIGAIAAGATYTAATGHTAFSTLTSADLTGMAGKLPTYARMGARWYISPAGYWESMARLQMAAGGNTTLDFGSGPVLTYAGYPVELVEIMNSTTTAQTSTNGICYFGNLAMAATIGTRKGLEVQVLRERYAETFTIGILAKQRYDINVHERGTASAAGPVIMLATPSS